MGDHGRAAKDGANQQSQRMLALLHCTATASQQRRRNRMKRRDGFRVHLCNVSMSPVSQSQPSTQHHADAVIVVKNTMQQCTKYSYHAYIDNREPARGLGAGAMQEQASSRQKLGIFAMRYEMSKTIKHAAACVPDCWS